MGYLACGEFLFLFQFLLQPFDFLGEILYGLLEVGHLSVNFRRIVDHIVIDFLVEVANAHIQIVQDGGENGAREEYEK